eukprot:CAMPEP_0115015452 /NCGR_PEP_ID=MMETSP0216-20121206/26784_1 /TAXON_ID=223996 /ORGANISM="Protocruzia adherens, Strain Boccale" /LENGTH=1622 /DNA_ID=CAMNT_0002385589 /DNA_START=185 /DNA_END=5053 /DNA_ORIENTATION=+
MSAREEFSEEAIPLVVVNPETNAFEFSAEAEEFLKKLKNPIGIIAVAGMYRTGKSYLLNRMLLSQKRGFEVGPTVNPCTKGLWIWGKPVQGYTPDGSPVDVLVIDTEGLGAFDEDTNHDTRVFSLAILFSSFFLYNSVGSLDESALNSLSFVVNLTKHIQLKAGSSNDELSEEDYASFFPNFLWVVRDFALQLVDEDGDPLSSREYLEKALEGQKGFSETIEQKNRIRRLLKTFFKDRDCVTLVRPLTDEDNLQNLEELEFDKLRPEFVEGVMELRKKVLNRMKPKMLNGKKLTGDMFSHLVKSYVVAINNGAVPCIDSAWNYICKNACQKALTQSIDLYDAQFMDGIQEQLPLEEEEIIEIHKAAKDEAISFFVEKSMGEFQKDFLNDLKSKFKQKLNVIIADNELETRRACSNFLRENYGEIEKKLKSQGFEHFNEFETELRSFQQFILEHGPLGPGRREIMLEFVKNALSDGALYFLNTVVSELDLQKQMSSETIRKLESNIKENKDEMIQERESLFKKVSAAENERTKLTVELEDVRDQLDDVSRAKEELERDTVENLQKEKAEFTKKLNESRNKVVLSEEKVKEMERNMISQQSEHEKELALLNQKIEYLEKSLDDFGKREKDYMSEIRNVKKDNSSTVKEIHQRYEGQITNYQKKSEYTQEKLSEMENEIQLKQGQFEAEKARWEEKERELEAKLEEATVMVSTLKNDKSKSDKSLEDLKGRLDNEYATGFEELNTKMEDLETKNKELEELLKTKQAAWDKESSIYIQKNEFLEVQLEESRQQLSEAQTQHEQMMKAIETRNSLSSSAKDDMDLQLGELKELHTREMKELEEQYDTSRKRLAGQLQEFQEKNSDLELKLKLEVNDHEKEVNQLKEVVEEKEALVQKLQGSNKSLESKKREMQDEIESKYASRVRELEHELEELRERSETDLKDGGLKAEQNLAQLKAFYESEKTRLEGRLNEEKTKYEKRLENQAEDYEEKLQEEQAAHEEDVEALQTELQEREADHGEMAGQMERQITISAQKIDSLERQVKEMKEQAKNLQEMNSTSMDQIQAKYAAEKTSLQTKIDALTNDLTFKERESTSLGHKVEKLKADIVKKNTLLEDVKQDASSERVALTERLENERTKAQTLSDELMKKKLDWTRETALSKQQQEFQGKKVEELQKYIEDLQKEHEQKLHLQKEEYNIELNDRIEKLKSEKEATDDKYEQKRKNLKEIEAKYSKQSASYEREKAVLEEKIKHLDSKVTEMTTKSQQDSQSSEGTIQKLNEQLNNERLKYQFNVEKLNSRVNDLERELADSFSNHERDKALWEGKSKFLEQQKEQSKRDLQEAQEKFRQAIERMKDRNGSENRHLENSHTTLIQTVESRYQSKIKDMQESFEREKTELVDKAKRMEDMYRGLKETIELDKRSRESDSSNLEKKLNESLSREETLQQDLEDIKAERDRKILEYQRLLDQDKENWKTKIHQLETKCKEVEQQKSSLLFDHEKERARWSYEKDNLVAQKNEAQDNIERLEKKRDQLLKDVTKAQNSKAGSSKRLVGNLASGLIRRGGASYKIGGEKSSASSTKGDSEYSFSKNFIENLMPKTDRSKAGDDSPAKSSVRSGSTAMDGSPEKN